MQFRHEKLEVWQLAMELVDLVYKATEQLPKSELFGLTNQIRRSAVSVALNIAEGANRESKKEFAHFIRTAIGSLMECDTGLKIALRLKMLKEKDPDSLNKIIEKLYFKLLALNKKLR